MEKINEAFIENEYLGNCVDSVFTTMLRESFAKSGIEFLRSYKFTHGLLLYPRWTPTTDIFQYLKPGLLEEIKKRNCFFVFDASTEGFSPIYEFPFFDILYFNCTKYNVDPSMIIYVSANLEDEKNIVNYCQEKNLKQINVFSFLSFEKVVMRHTPIELCQKNCTETFTGKYLSSLSRVNRQFRTMATFLLCHSNIADKALISHNVFGQGTNIDNWKIYHQLTEYKNDEIKSWLDSLPLIIDKSNFEVNWALENNYGTIHDQTLFQIVNETLVNNSNNTSLFYSEKTFRPVAYYQPFLIFGQQNCNKRLKDFGYKTYEKWFDLDFDSEPDAKLRYKKLLKSITDTSQHLDGLTNDQKIEWRFQDREILEHNKKIMNASAYSRDKMFNFLKGLSNAFN